MLVTPLSNTRCDFVRKRKGEKRAWDNERKGKTVNKKKKRKISKILKFRNFLRGWCGTDVMRV